MESPLQFAGQSENHALLFQRHHSAQLARPWPADPELLLDELR